MDLLPLLSQVQRHIKIECTEAAYSCNESCTRPSTNRAISLPNNVAVTSFWGTVLTVRCRHDYLFRWGAPSSAHRDKCNNDGSAKLPGLEKKSISFFYYSLLNPCLQRLHDIRRWQRKLLWRSVPCTVLSVEKDQRENFTPLGPPPGSGKVLPERGRTIAPCTGQWLYCRVELHYKWSTSWVGWAESREA